MHAAVINAPNGKLFYEKLRHKIDREEFDYQMLLDTLRNYSRPRDKITDLLRKGVIIRVKKGLYVLMGFVLGCLAAGIFSARFLEAQSAFTETGSKDYSFESMMPSIPASFGRLVAVSGINLYFEGQNGVVYVVKPRSGNTFDSQVTMIPRS